MKRPTTMRNSAITTNRVNHTKETDLSRKAIRAATIIKGTWMYIPRELGRAIIAPPKSPKTVL